MAERERAAPGFLFGLAPDGVFRAMPVARQAVSSYLAFSPLPCPCGRGGLFSVALSVERLAPPSRVYLRLDAWRRDEVTRHRALWCSDFPPPALTAGSGPPPDRNRGEYKRVGEEWQVPLEIGRSCWKGSLLNWKFRQLNERKRRSNWRLVSES